MRSPVLDDADKIVECNAQADGRHHFDQHEGDKGIDQLVHGHDRGSGRLLDLPVGLVVPWLAAHTLEIADVRQGAIFRFREKALRRSMQQLQFLTQHRGTLLRQRLNQVFQHGSQAPGDLDAGAAELTDFGDGQLDEILPVRRPVEEPQPARFVAYPFVVQTCRCPRREGGDESGPGRERRWSGR